MNLIRAPLETPDPALAALRVIAPGSQALRDTLTGIRAILGERLTALQSDLRRL
jgi:hypothetical protein